MKKLINYLINVVKSDFNSLRIEYLLRRERLLLKKALKMAYSLHMINNKRYYVIRMSVNSAVNIPSALTSGMFIKKNSACILLTSYQAKYLVEKHAINKTFWLRRFNLPDVHVIDGYFTKAMQKSFIRNELLKV